MNKSLHSLITTEMSFGFFVQGISSFCGKAVVKTTFTLSGLIFGFGFIHLIKPGGLIPIINPPMTLFEPN